MNTFDLSRWLWDFYSCATVLLSVALVANFLIAQPARRMVIAWSTAWGLLALALLTAVPNWSQYSLASLPMPESVEESETFSAPNAPPNFEQQSQQPQQQIAFPPPNMAAVETAPPNVVTIDWAGIAMTALLMGSALVVCWLAIGAWQVRRLCASASPAPDEINRILSELSQGKLPTSQLGISQNLPVAVAVGLARPWILLPQTLTRANREQASSVLAHELAHVANHDLWLLAILRLLSVLLWPHPLFWLLRRQVRLDQELLADAAAAELTNRGTYAEQLVALARSAVESRVPRLASSVGLWERPSQLTQRIALLLDDKLTILRNCSRSWRIGSAGMLAILALALSLVTLAPRAAESRADTETARLEESPSVPSQKLAELMKQAETKEGFADAVGDLVAAAIRPSQLPFVSDKRLAAIRYDFVMFVNQHTPADITAKHKAELLVGLRDHAQQHMQLWNKPITENRDLDNVYLNFPDRLKTLKWELWMALTRTPLDKESFAKRDIQRIWMRKKILDEPKHRHDTHTKVLEDLEAKFDDPLCVIFDRPMSDEAFAKFQTEINNWLAQKPEPNSTQKLERNEKSGLWRPATDSELPHMVHHLLWEALIAQYRGERAQFNGPNFDDDEIGGYGVGGSFLHLSFASNRANKSSSLSLSGFEGSGNSINADTGYMADTTVKGDFGFSARDMKIMAFNGTKLFPLQVDNWIEADAISVEDLKSKLANSGVDEVDLGAFLQLKREQFIQDLQQGRGGAPYTHAQNLEEALAAWEGMQDGEGPYVAVLTNEGNIAVAHVTELRGKNLRDISVRTRVRPKPVTDETVGQINAQAGAVAQVGKPALKQLRDGLNSQLTPNMVTGVCYGENNQPLAGVNVEVLVARSNSNEPPYRANQGKTDHNGIFRFENVVDIEKDFPLGLPEQFILLNNPPVVLVVARTPGRVPGIGNEVAIRIAQSGISMPLLMPPAHTLSGQVLDEGGKPVEGARVSVGHWTNVSGMPTDINADMTDSDGRFEIADLEVFDAEKARLEFETRQKQGVQFLSYVNDGIGKPWERSILVTHPRFARKRAIYSSIPGTVTAALSPGAVVTGMVFTQEVGASPQPAGNIEVVLQGQPEEGKGDTMGHQFLRANSNEQGEFRFESLPPGTYSIGSTAEGWVTRGIDNIDVSKGQELAATDLVMTRGGKVRVKLVDSATGKPLEFNKAATGSIVPVPRPEAKQFWYPETMVEFALDGHGELQLPPRRYSFLVSVMGKDGQYAWQSADFENLASARDIEKIPAYEIVEGETLEIDVPMIRPERIPQAILSPNAQDLKADEESKPTGTLFKSTIPAE